MAGTHPRVALFCDVGPQASRTPLVRCLALAEELVSRGVGVVVACAAEADLWADTQLRARGLHVVTPASTAQEHVELVEQVGADRVVFDSPAGSDEAVAAVRRTGRRTLAVVEGRTRTPQADVLLDPSWAGAEQPPRSRDATVLAGPEYALLRNDVLANRPITAPERRDAAVPRVLALVSDADARATPQSLRTLLRVLVATRRPFEVTVVGEGLGMRDVLGDVRLDAEQHLAVAAPGHRFFEQVARADVLLADAGPAAMELLCVGAAAALVWVSEDQVQTYRPLMVRRAVLGLGGLDGLRGDMDQAAARVALLLRDPAERTRLSQTAWRLVDGLGRARVADVLLAGS